METDELMSLDVMVIDSSFKDPTLLEVNEPNLKDIAFRAFYQLIYGGDKHQFHYDSEEKKWYLPNFKALTPEDLYNEETTQKYFAQQAYQYIIQQELPMNYKNPIKGHDNFYGVYGDEVRIIDFSLAGTITSKGFNQSIFSSNDSLIGEIIRREANNIVRRYSSRKNQAELILDTLKRDSSENDESIQLVYERIDEFKKLTKLI